METTGRIQLYKYMDDHFNVHHSISENYEDPFTALHMHSMYELYMFVDGKAEASVSGNIYKLEPGMIMLMRPGEAHSINVASHKRYERTVIHFDGSYFDSMPAMRSILKMLGKPESGTGNCFMPEKDKAYCQRLISEMINPKIRSDAARLTALCTNLPALLYFLSTHSTNTESVHSISSDKTVRQIIKYIDENLYNHWTLDDLALALYRDKAYLNRRFKKVVGTGIWDYTIKKRIIGIKQKIHSFSGVNEAFRESGFGDYSSFFRNYVKITGCTPSDDIKKHDLQ